MTTHEQLQTTNPVPYGEGLYIAGILAGIVGLFIGGVILGPAAIALQAMDNGKRRYHGLPPRYGVMVFGLVVFVISVILMGMIL